MPGSGGTALRDALFMPLVQRLGHDQVFLIDLDSDICRTGSFEDFMALSKPEKERLRFITGHASIRILDGVPSPYSFTMLREPINSALSAYWYCFHNDHHPAHARARSLTAVDFIVGGWGEARNGQARYLSGHSFQDGSQIGEEVLEGAKRALERISYIGFFNQFETVVSDVCAFAKHRGTLRDPSHDWRSSAKLFRAKIYPRSRPAIEQTLRFMSGL